MIGVVKSVSDIVPITAKSSGRQVNYNLLYCHQNCRN